MSGEKDVEICRVEVCACIIGPRMNVVRSSRTNVQSKSLKHTNIYMRAIEGQWPLRGYRSQAVLEKVASSNPQAGMANSRGLWLVVG